MKKRAWKIKGDERYSMTLFYGTRLDWLRYKLRHYRRRHRHQAELQAYRLREYPLDLSRVQRDK